MHKTLIVGVLVAGATVASAQERTRERVQPTAPGDTAVISREQFRGLAWITGRWRGTGAGALSSVSAFFEEYAMVDDSTVRMRASSNAEFSNIIDSTRFEWRRGRLAAVPARGRSRVLTRLAGDSVFWSGNGATYLRISNDHWRAIFDSRTPGGERPYYDMHRIPAVPAPATQPQAPAPARPLPADSLALARTYARWFLTGIADSLFAQVVPGGNGILASRDSLARVMQLIAVGGGQPLQLLEERFVWRNGVRQYWRTYTIERPPEPGPFLLRFAMRADGKITGLGLGGASRAPQIDSGGPVIKP